MHGGTRYGQGLSLKGMATDSERPAEVQGRPSQYMLHPGGGRSGEASLCREHPHLTGLPRRSRLLFGVPLRVPEAGEGRPRSSFHSCLP